MNKNICLRCGTEFKHRSNLNQHFKRKNICQPLLNDISYDDMKKSYNLLRKKYLYDVSSTTKNSFMCEYCEKEFSSHQSYYRHKTNNCKENQLKKEIIELRKEVDELKNNMKQLKQIILKKSNDNCNNLNDDCKMNEFNCEEINLSNKEIRNTIIRKKYMSVLNLVEKIYFQCPENSSFYVTKRDKYGLIYKGGRWIYKEKLDIVETVMSNIISLIIDFVDEHDMKYPCDFDKDKVEEICFTLGKETKERSVCFESVLKVCYNNASIVRNNYESVSGKKFKAPT